ncbi:hypothetical protein F4677DRAFT_25067 [Hypoxylon crocopeplum]|nr:hypothetical protein F4677DRAFT_25067 [Hypoxylon crocopeplum]
MPDPNNYTVGWICAVGTELVAAKEFLDERHDAPDHVPAHDNNAYTLGIMGKHNVVIVALPMGEYGITNAATVGRDMARSFPNLRIILMVGIGGGAPSPKHDIRLGDVVVGTPGNGNGGVFQYDYGKTIQGRSFTFTGHMNQPPHFVLTTLAVLNGEYESDGHSIEEMVSRILQAKPRLRKKYQRPHPSTDRLYKSTSQHAGSDELDCATTCGGGESNLVFREERQEDEDNPAIHYGLIASANQLMKNALIRDKLSTEKNVLCFEMEAAGLVNQFPSLVIRGICDYSDSHKNKLWQGYASMTAAAYAKDLISRIAPNKIEAERKLGEVLSEVNEGLSHVRSGVASLQEGHHLASLQEWLSPPDPSTNVNRALDLRHDNTGQWFLQSLEYSTWKTEKNSFLWLNGIPGCGKTILASTVVNDLRTSETSYPHLLYFYFDFADAQKQSVEYALCSLISQLYQKRDNVRSYLDSLYSSCDCGPRRPDVGSLQNTFRDMVQAAGELWIILDALDECTTRNGSPKGGLLRWIQSLQGTQTNVHILVTSRPEEDIKAAIRKWAQNQDKFMVPLQGSWMGEDIRNFIRARVRESEGLSRWRTRPKVQEEIENTLTKKANGMSRWVACQLDSLENCLDLAAVKEALRSLPKTLDETYARILAGIPQEYHHRTIRILQLLIHSKEPLVFNQIVDAIAVDTTSISLFDPDNRMPVPEEITRYLSSLVVVVVVNRNDRNHWGFDQMVIEVQLAHFSVKEYLMSDRAGEDIAKPLSEFHANASIAELCLAYLIHIGRCWRGWRLDNEPCESYPLLTYAETYWIKHAIVVETWPNIQKWIREFISGENQFNRSRQGESIIYKASERGLVETVRNLINEGNDVNTQGGYYGNALQAAATRTNENIAKLLLEEGANVNAQGGHYGNALQAATSNEYIAKLLLEEGANVNSQGGVFNNVLNAAITLRKENILSILIEYGADINKKNRRGETPLQIALRKKSEGVARILREAEAEECSPEIIEQTGSKMKRDSEC